MKDLGGVSGADRIRMVPIESVFVPDNGPGKHHARWIEILAEHLTEPAAGQFANIGSRVHDLGGSDDDPDRKIVDSLSGGEHVGPKSDLDREVGFDTSKRRIWRPPPPKAGWGIKTDESLCGQVVGSFDGPHPVSTSTEGDA